MQTKKEWLLIPLLPFCSILFLQLSAYVGTTLTQTREIYLSFVIFQMMIFVLPVVFFCKARGEDYIFRIKLRFFGLEKAVFLLFAVFLMIASMTAMELGMRKLGFSGGLFSNSIYSLYESSLSAMEENVHDTLYTVIVYAFLPAIAEELLFRSVLFTEYERCGAPAAIALTAVLYALIGLNPASLLPSLVGGVILGFSVYITGSVFAPMFIHFCYNLYSLFFEEYIWTFTSKPENELFFLFVLGCILLVSAVMVCSQAERILYDMGIKGRPLPDYLTDAPAVRPKDSFARCLVSPFYIGCAVLYILRVTGIL